MLCTSDEAATSLAAQWSQLPFVLSCLKQADHKLLAQLTVRNFLLSDSCGNAPGGGMQEKHAQKQFRLFLKKVVANDYVSAEAKGGSSKLPYQGCSKPLYQASRALSFPVLVPCMQLSVSQRCGCILPHVQADLAKISVPTSSLSAGVKTSDRGLKDAFKENNREVDCAKDTPKERRTVAWGSVASISLGDLTATKLLISARSGVYERYLILAWITWLLYCQSSSHLKEGDGSGLSDGFDGFIEHVLSVDDFQLSKACFGSFEGAISQSLEGFNRAQREQAKRQFDCWFSLKT